MENLLFLGVPILKHIRVDMQFNYLLVFVSPGTMAVSRNKTYVLLFKCLPGISAVSVFRFPLGIQEPVQVIQGK